LVTDAEKGGVVVNGYYPEANNISRTGFLPGSFSGGSPFGGFGPLENIGGFRAEFVTFKNMEKHRGNGQHRSSAPPPNAPPPQNPPAPSAPVAGVFSDWQQMAPLGSRANPIHINDSFLFRVLASERATISSTNVRGMGYGEWWDYMLALNVRPLYNTSYYSYDGYLSELSGVFSGHEINYLGVGMGFAASGMSEAQMNLYIYGWKDWQYVQYGLSGQWSRLPWSGIRGGELIWAKLGYAYYANDGDL